MNDLKKRKIIHVDMDSFFASIEIRDNPSLKNKPVIIAGKSKYHGVVSTASYTARRYGVHSAMPVSQAFKLCPQGILIPTNMQKYKMVSKKIMDIFKRFSDKVEPLSLDEAYIDVTENKFNLKSASKIAKIIQKTIKKELNLTCSCGVSYNKFLAKTASDVNKPNGICIITRDNQAKFIEGMKIQNFYGIGKKTAKKLISRGIYTGLDLKNLSQDELDKIFGTRSTYFYNIARGIDTREVVFKRKIKSISSERTYFELLYTDDELNKSFIENFERSYSRLLEKKFYCKTITVKIRDGNFKTITRSKSIENFTNNKKILLKNFKDLLQKVSTINGVRLFGIGFSNLKQQDEIKLLNEQLTADSKIEQLNLDI